MLPRESRRPLFAANGRGALGSTTVVTYQVTQRDAFSDAAVNEMPVDENGVRDLLQVTRLLAAKFLSAPNKVHIAITLEMTSWTSGIGCD